MKRLENNNTSYGKMHKCLHWLLALNIGTTLVLSAGMAGLTDAQKEVEPGDHAFKRDARAEDWQWIDR